ncbi:YbaK/EbsC family protein [Antarcticimicrobium luteum]|uniref:YbaK/EbsC family protein n=1 Tax=Antarcticimicrobium luteum TaxID=2547397 RepID=A0A4R5VCG5_9RHOB|nr:YbaK/EbsC family protein [Antarcticimicrobium luteum]TDK50008.1 YbaK/EbsC family protein [Antarcticimicrobium luteum]
MSKSTRRVERAAAAAGLDMSVLHMPASTRTAQEAAAACACDVGQIVKSMIFEGVDSGELKLLLVSGRHDVNLDAASGMFDEGLRRADPGRVREETGFAIGGVAPIGHLSAIDTWMDNALLQYPAVWAAAGAPNAVFRVAPDALLRATGARVFHNGA